MTQQDGVAVHLAELDAAILDDPGRNDLEIGDLFRRLGASVGFDEADHDVHPLLLEPLPFSKHGVGLADPRRRAEIDLQPSPGLTADQVEELLGAGSCWLLADHGQDPL